MDKPALNHIVATFFYQPPWVNDCALEWLYSNLTEPCPQPGLNTEMFKFMMQMLNCTYDIIVTKEIGLPNADNEWSGMLGVVMRGEANMSINTPYQVEVRAKAVKWMLPNGHSKVAVLIPKRVARLVTNTIFLPFSFYSWTLIFASLGFVTALAILIIFIRAKLIHKEKHRNRNDVFLKEGIRAVEAFVSALIHHGHETSRKNPYKYLLLSWQFTTMVVGMMYGEALYAFFVRPPQPQIPFDDVGGLADAMLTGQYKLMLPQGIYQFMQNALATSSVPGMVKLKTAFESMPIRVISNEERFVGPTYMQEDTAFLDIDMVQGLMVARNCAVTLIDLKDMEGNFYAPSFTKSFEYMEEFNLFGDIQAQFYKRLEYIYAASETPAPCNFVSSGMLSISNLSLDHTWVIFLICFVGMLIASISAINKLNIIPMLCFITLLIFLVVVFALQLVIHQRKQQNLASRTPEIEIQIEDRLQQEYTGENQMELSSFNYEALQNTNTDFTRPI